MLNSPFKVLCPCGTPMHPMNEPHPDNTRPTARSKEVNIVFWCDACGHAENHIYVLPILRDDVSKNLIMLLKHKLEMQQQVLPFVVTLNASNFIEEKGLYWALGDLQQKGIVYDVEGLDFKLTLLGQLLLWHGPY